MNRRDSSWRRRAGALVAAALALACSGDPSATEPAPGRVEPVALGSAAYAQRLAERSGSDLAPARLAQLASGLEAAVESKLVALAEAIRPGSDWRELFAQLRLDHPRTVDAVLESYRREVDRAAAFVAERDLVSLPPAPPEILEAGNKLLRESFPLALYLGGSLAVTTSATETPDPAYLANHCRICVPPLAVHEGYPGHHVAYYHATVAADGLTLGEPVQIRTRPASPFFHEGWGQYSEILMLERGYYEGEPELELGAWRLVLLRALRARVDVELHTGAIGADAAAALYRERLLADPGSARAEARRHLEDATGKASYFVGLVQILELRRRAMEADPSLGEREFHDRLLRRPGPISEVGRREFGIESEETGEIDWAAPLG